MSAEGIFLLILVALVSGLAGTAFGVIWLAAAELGWKCAATAFFYGAGFPVRGIREWVGTSRDRDRDDDGEAQR